MTHLIRNWPEDAAVALSKGCSVQPNSKISRHCSFTPALCRLPARSLWVVNNLSMMVLCEAHDECFTKHMLPHSDDEHERHDPLQILFQEVGGWA